MPNKKSVVNVHDAKTQFSRLLERAHRGEVIILAKAGQPYAKLVPLDEGEERAPGSLRGLILSDSFFDPLPADELGAWEGNDSAGRKSKKRRRERPR
jgi:prevent-host-death family protein